jgi:hypothetical protein
MGYSTTPSTGYTIWITSSTDFVLKASNYNDPNTVVSTTLSTAMRGNVPMIKVLGLSFFSNVFFVNVE